MVEKFQHFVLTQDTVGLLRRINNTKGGAPSNQKAPPDVTSIAKNYMEEVTGHFEGRLEPGVQMKTFFEDEIDQRLTAKITPVLEENPSAMVICLDRFLLPGLEETAGDRFARFSMCRTVGGNKEPRQGAPSFGQQAQQLLEKYPALPEKDIVIVDDGLFSGGTVKDFIQVMEENGVALKVSKIIGFVGGNPKKYINGVKDVEIIEPINDLYDWVDVRDLGPFGGKKISAGRTNRVTSSEPYIFPWSDGSGASLNMSPYFFDISTGLIQSFQKLIRSNEELDGGDPLTIKDLVRAGFPIPTDRSKKIPVELEDTVNGYLDRCLGRIEQERRRRVGVFDMDGTLYQLNGNNHGFSGSSLEKGILANARKFIYDRESNKSEVDQVMQDGLADEVGLSQYLSKRYNIPRAEYLNYAWDIEPKDIVKNWEQSGDSIKRFFDKDPEAKFLLLTSAPRIWADRVLELAGVRGLFEQEFTAENYTTKQTVFKMLAGRYDPSRVISIGDQEHSDILPARALGMQTKLVTSPRDLATLQWKK